MKKILSVVLCVFVMLSIMAPVCFADETDVELTINPNKRYTDISMIEDDPLLFEESQSKKETQDRTTYIIILVVLLVAAIGVLIYTLKKVPSEKEIEDKDTAEILGNNESGENKEE